MISDAANPRYLGSYSTSTSNMSARSNIIFFILDKIENTLTSFYRDLTYKEVKFFSKSLNTFLKLKGHEDIAVISSSIKKIARFEGIFEFIQQGKLKLDGLAILGQLQTNKGQREITKKVWVILTVLEQMSLLAYATGFITEESVLYIALAHRMSKYAKQFLSVQHGMMLGQKSIQKPDSEKVAGWNFSLMKGAIKVPILGSKFLKLNKEFGQLGSVVTGGMSLVKRKHFTKRKKELKLQKKGLKLLEPVESLQETAVINTSVDYRKIVLLALRILVIMTIISELYLNQE